MKLLICLALASPFLSGCAGDERSGPSPGDPAHPDSLETAWSAPPDRLKEPVEFPEAQTPDNPTSWTCPMHPEVKADKPGKCPQCGMALEPAKQEHHHK